MAGFRQPGPTYDYNAPASVVDGTSSLVASPLPGPTSLNPDRLVSRAAHLVQSIYDTDVRIIAGSVSLVASTTREVWEGADCIYQAYLEALILAPQAIFDETSFDLSLAVRSFLPELLRMLAKLGAATFFGSVVGGAVGFVLGGGAGAAPGVVVGGELGLDLGLAILTWLGLGYLACSVVEGFAELFQVLKYGLDLAWSAKHLRGVGRTNLVKFAGHELARTAGILTRLILLGVIAYLTKKTAVDSTKKAASLAQMVNRDGAGVVSEARVAQLVESLRSSRFGTEFGSWIEQNWRKLVGPQKLRDISKNFKFTESIIGDRRIKTAEGELGLRGEVVIYKREPKLGKLSKGTGDDRGHLIGLQFGAPDCEENLGLQNRTMNRHLPEDKEEVPDHPDNLRAIFGGAGGAYANLENRWASLLREGYRVFVTVTDQYRIGKDEVRFFNREVKWTATPPVGKKRDGGTVNYLNPDSPQRRKAGDGAKR